MAAPTPNYVFSLTLTRMAALVASCPLLITETGLADADEVEAQRVYYTLDRLDDASALDSTGNIKMPYVRIMFDEGVSGDVDGGFNAGIPVLIRFERYVDTDNESTAKEKEIGFSNLLGALWCHIATNYPAHDLNVTSISLAGRDLGDRDEDGPEYYGAVLEVMIN